MSGEPQLLAGAIPEDAASSSILSNSVSLLRRRYLSSTESTVSVNLTDKGYNALWVGFVVCFLSTAYFIRASVHSHSKVRSGWKEGEGRGGVRSSTSNPPDLAP